MKNNIINELRFASKKKKNAVLGYVYCDYLLDIFEEIERLNNIRKEVREYIEEKEKDDDNWIDYELCIEPAVIKEILEKEVIKSE